MYSVQCTFYITGILIGCVNMELVLNNNVKLYMSNTPDEWRSTSVQSA